MIREYLPWELAKGTTEGFGMWDGDALRAVAAWTEQGGPLVWRCNVVAVARGWHRHGYGLAMKQAVVDEARSRGCLLVTSLIHRDNDAMLELNKVKFKADCQLDPDDPLKNTMICTITV